mmetsp:Transcript_74372/g.208806  ORF Transcript_74372/g.208806 Transcript_74372/m.208806 type:complete len:214 (+) Transcript_74372:47-688(+)
MSNLHIVWGQVSDNESSGRGSNDRSRDNQEVDFRELSSSGTLSSHILSTSSRAQPSREPCPAPRFEPFASSDNTTLPRSDVAGASKEVILSRAGFWSKGSAKHDRGRCKPCRFVYSRTGCESGAECAFCHLPHTDNSRNRIGVSKRDYCKSLAEKLRDSCEGEPETLVEIARSATSKSSYLGLLLQGDIALGEGHSAHDAPELGGSRSLKLSL